MWKGEVRNRREQRVGAWPRAGKTLLSYSLLALKYNDLGVSQVRGSAFVGPRPAGLAYSPVPCPLGGAPNLGLWWTLLGKVHFG